MGFEKFSKKFSLYFLLGILLHLKSLQYILPEFGLWLKLNS